jgi:thiol-disulfide isomerase/thioredoxin
MTEFESTSAVSENQLRNRRRWLLGAVASAAALGGIGLARRNSQSQAVMQSVESGLWQLEFATPQGALLRLSSLQGKPLVLNFWATWCQPCVEELPLLSDFYQKNLANGWQVLGFAVDQPDPVNRFLTRVPVTFPVVMAGMSGIELSRSLGNLSGALPFTVVLGSDGHVAHRKMGKLTVADLRQWRELK